MFEDYHELSALDLGCGVGRNCIEIAREYKNIGCIIDGVDILDIAIEKLYHNAEKYNVTSCIRGIVSTIEDYEITPNTYDLILGISALEHIESEEQFVAKLGEIRDGVRDNGIVCLVVNSNVREADNRTGESVPAQFEINMSAGKMKATLEEIFGGWKVLKGTIQEQQYDIPREFGISKLSTSVVTLVARKTNG